MLSCTVFCTTKYASSNNYKRSHLFYQNLSNPTRTWYKIEMGQNLEHKLGLLTFKNVIKKCIGF